MRHQRSFLTEYCHNLGLGRELMPKVRGDQQTQMAPLKAPFSDTSISSSLNCIFVLKLNHFPFATDVLKSSVSVICSVVKCSSEKDCDLSE